MELGGCLVKCYCLLHRLGVPIDPFTYLNLIFGGSSHATRVRTGESHPFLLNWPSAT